jgi:hypothetical protein
MASLVVDSGRLTWLIGVAGDDSPDVNPRTQQQYDANTFPAHCNSEALRQRWRDNATLFSDYARGRRLIAHDDDEFDPDDGFDLDHTAVFTCSVCDDAESQNLRDILSMVFAPNAEHGISLVDIVPQEVLMLYASGRVTGLVVNLGFHLTVMGMYEGHLLGETVRRVPMLASEDAFIADPAAWEQRIHLGALVTEAIEAAPIDTRKELARSVVVSGGSWGGWAGIKEHLTAHATQLYKWDTTRSMGHVSHHVNVVRPPEAGAAAWIGGSILGTLGAYRNTAMRTRDQWLRSTPHEHPERWHPPRLAVPPDREADVAARRARAIELVRSAPLLCAKLPEELQAAVAELVAPRLTYPDVPALRTTAFLPPQEPGGGGGGAALNERLARVVSVEDPPQQMTELKSDALTNLARCFAEVAAKVAAGERWLVQPRPPAERGYHGAYGLRVGDTMFTLV